MPQEKNVETYSVCLELFYDDIMKERQRYREKKMKKLERKIRRAKKRFVYFRNRHVRLFREYGLDYMRNVKGFGDGI